MNIFGIVGSSGSGKTTLIEKLIPYLKDKGLSVSCIKHTHHRFDMDKPGKDSFRHREAGASEVMLASSQRWALLHELRDEDEPEIEELLKHMSEVDLVLVEGFKNHDHPKLEVYRPEHGRDNLWPKDQSIVAVASDDILDTDNRYLLELDDTEEVGDFIYAFITAKDTS